MSGMSDSSQSVKLFLSPQDYFSEIVDEGLAKFHLHIAPPVKNYLVSILEHHIDAWNLYDEPVNELGEWQPQTMAELYLSASLEEPAQKFERLKNIIVF